MLESLTRAGAVILSMTGLAMLAHLDVPDIRRGGITAGLAALDLFAAAVVVSVLVMVAARQR